MSQSDERRPALPPDAAAARPAAGELAAVFAHGVVAPAEPGRSVPAVEAAAVRHPHDGTPDVSITALAVPGHPDGEVDTRPHALPRRPRPLTR